MRRCGNLAVGRGPRFVFMRPCAPWCIALTDITGVGNESISFRYLSRGREILIGGNQQFVCPLVLVWCRKHFDWEWIPEIKFCKWQDRPSFIRIRSLCLSSKNSGYFAYCCSVAGAPKVLVRWSPTSQHRPRVVAVPTSFHLPIPPQAAHSQAIFGILGME